MLTALIVIRAVVLNINRDSFLKEEIRSHMQQDKKRKCNKPEGNKVLFGEFIT